MRWTLSAVAVAGAIFGCGRPPEPAHFAGRRLEARTPADRVAEVEVGPPGYTILGRVSGSCVDEHVVEAIDHDWLGEIVCSDEMLLESLREKAADVGGDLLVRPRCTADEDAEAVARTCRARVARAETAPPEVLPAGAKLRAVSAGRLADAPWLAEPLEAWRVGVSFAPAPTSVPRPARDPDEVREAPRLPASDVPLGDVIARCHGECGDAVVREAVRATAARVGADSVSEVHCVDREQGRLCTGRAGRHEVDPRVVAEAR